MDMQMKLLPPSAPKAPKNRWVERVLTDWWDVLAAEVPANWMPVSAATANKRRRRRLLTEYGCGRYGCVFPTGDPSVVFKLTSDQSEAAFVGAAMQIGEWPAGIVRYHKLFQLEGETHYKRPIYALWRQEAQNVGLLVSHAGNAWYQKRFGRGVCRDFASDLTAFLLTSHKIRTVVQRSRNPAKLIKRAQDRATWAWRLYMRAAPTNLKGADLVAFTRLQCASLAQFMQGRECGYLVGETLDFYLEHGLLLADVHLGNIGEATPEDYSTWELVITDPGHMVPLDPKWLKVDIPLLELPGALF